ncbi:uncharacterized protein LOC126747063 [Anthonomus grandis grandis]|uniref:uncharacterized protein LOC126747063 n=1 Tax=Anthonomus grandis grandis TaxID=2921223 RepID=UPI002166037B|nr:uncharacterized protein LOC126747063 [Anthonomus grandis grandis]
MQLASTCHYPNYLCALFCGSMEDEDVFVVTALCVLNVQNYLNVLRYAMEKKGRRRKRRWWMTAIHRNRTLTSMNNFFNDLTCEESGDFFNFCRMSRIDFEFLLNKIEPMIKRETKIRVPILPKMRLAITLRYLATGDSYKSLHYLFKVSTAAISLIVPEVCGAINLILKNQIKLPDTPEQWLAIEKGFRKKFPRCVGAFDGKHIVIKCPPHTGSEYYNYKGTYSIVLMALVDNDYKFIFADVGGQGRISDGGIFQNYLLWKKIDTNQLNLPPDVPLPGRETSTPYVFLGDGAFALHKNVMKPFPGNHDMGTKERIFNYKLSSSRVIVENTFGVLTSVFRVFKKPIEIDVSKVPKITLTSIILTAYLLQGCMRISILIDAILLQKFFFGSYIVCERLETFGCPCFGDNAGDAPKTT